MFDRLTVKAIADYLRDNRVKLVDGHYYLGENGVEDVPTGLWLGDSRLCSCGFVFDGRWKSCPKCSSDTAVSLEKLLNRLLEVKTCPPTKT